MEIWTTGPEQTQTLGRIIGELVEAGCVLCLQGDLGVGKTVLAQGIGWGLGVIEVMNSPTFTLVQQYTGRLPLNHLDLYRIEEPAELEQLGWEDFVWGKGVTLIEWPDRLLEELLPDFLQITLSKVLEQGKDIRRIELQGRGEQGEHLALVIKQALSGKEGFHAGFGN